MHLAPVMKRFVLHWGEMGTRWGVNRTVAQIHALLYLTPAPLPAEEIAETLSVARSNVSTSLKELQSWGLVSIAHVLGDRRDHFVARADPWDMFLTILEQRKRREIEPTLNFLRECVAEMEKDRNTPSEVKARIDKMRGFLTDLTEWFDQIVKLPRATLVSVMRLGATIGSLVPRIAKKA
jgi:DNA-binding transcriptional regulator GbsR (MarR family)